MGKFIVGLIIGLLVIPVVAIFYVETGRVPVAANAKPLPFEAFLAHSALHKTAEREGPQGDASKFSDEQLMEGAKIYRQTCDGCHGTPVQPSPVGRMMFPHAPQLFTAQGNVTDDPVGSTFWKIKNGIRLSGMPTFQSMLSDAQIWDLSALLARADKLPPDVQARLNAAEGAPVPAPAQPQKGASRKSAGRKKK